MVGVVYKHTNKLNNKAYIGRTIQTIKNRTKEGYKNTLFGNVLDKYGWDNFDTTILYTVEADSPLGLITLLNVIEEQQIKLHSSNQREYGYNIRSGGEFGHFKHTSEAIEKIREAARRPNSGQFQKGHVSPNKGKTYVQTEEQKLNTSQALKKAYAEGRRTGLNKGKKMSEEHKAALKAGWARKKALK